MFRSLGKLTALVLLAGMAAAGAMGWRSREDVARYLRMRDM
jgi:hypothetical protein